MPTIPVVFAIEHSEHPDPTSDQASPNHYAFFIGAMELPRPTPQAGLLSTAANAKMLGRFEAALLASAAEDGDAIDLSMFGADVLHVQGLAPFVAFTALAESNLLLDERQDWTRFHLFAAAQAALGAFVLDMDEFFPQEPAERAEAINAWSELCMDPGYAHRRPPPPTEPFLLAFAQWEAKALESALACDPDGDRSASQPPPANSLPKRPPRSL